MATPSVDSRPNVMIVIADCARELSPDANSPPMTQKLVAETPAEFVLYPRAVAPATWSLPSHASIFTGLYPWHHACHSLGELRLRPEFTTLASRLRGIGYATAAFSSNCVLAPETGLLNGFEVAAWGRWSENIFRSGSERPPHSLDLRHAPSSPSASGVQLLSAAAGSTLRHVPLFGFAFNRAVARVRDPSTRRLAAVSPWVERSFERWLSTVPSEQPIFATVNLMDLHEPYQADLSGGNGASGDLRYSLIPQDGRTYSLGPQDRPVAWTGTVRHLYSEALRRASERIAKLWEVLDRAHRSERTLLMVTSDHGQSLGEDGWFFHSHGQLFDELTRVPLALHYPSLSGTEIARKRAENWVSLVDLAPTVADVVGADSWGPWDGTSLLSNGLPEETRIAYSAGDGPTRHPTERGPTDGGTPRQRSASCVAFAGSTRILATGFADGSVEVRRTPVDAPRAESRDATEAVVERAAQGTLSAIVVMLSGTAAPPSAEVSRRLSSWGYG